MAMSTSDAEGQGLINLVAETQAEMNRAIQARLAYQASPDYVPPPPPSRWTRARWRVRYGIRHARHRVAVWISPYDDGEW